MRPRWDDYAEAAEDHVARLFGLEHGHRIKGRPDDGCDLVIDGKCIDVKWRESGLTLNVPQWKPLRAAVYVLVIGRPGRFYAVGWATRAEVKRAPVLEGGRRKSTNRPAPYYSMPAADLRPMSSLGARQASQERCATCGTPAPRRFMNLSPAFDCGPHPPFLG